MLLLLLSHHSSATKLASIRSRIGWIAGFSNSRTQEAEEELTSLRPARVSFQEPLSKNQRGVGRGSGGGRGRERERAHQPAPTTPLPPTELLFLSGMDYMKLKGVQNHSVYTKHCIGISVGIVLDSVDQFTENCHPDNMELHNL